MPSQECLDGKCSVPPLEQRRTAGIVPDVDVLRNVVVQSEPLSHLRHQKISDRIAKICQPPA